MGGHVGRGGGPAVPASRTPPRPAGGGRCSFLSSFVLQTEPPASGDEAHDLRGVGMEGDSRGRGRHSGLPLKDAPRWLEETWGNTRQPPVSALLVRMSHFTSPALVCVGIGYESAPGPGPVLAAGSPSHSALHPGGLSPHREARNQDGPEVAPGALETRDLQFRVGGPESTPKRPHGSM